MKRRPAAGPPDRRTGVALALRVGRWGLRGVSLLMLLFLLTSLFGDRVELDPGNTGRADVATPYLEQVAAGLAADRVFVDPALAGIPAADGVASGRVLAGRAGDVHVAVLAVRSDDGSTGRLDLTGRRLQHLVDRDGLYVVVDQAGQCTGLRFETGTDADTDTDTAAQEVCDTTFSAAELDRLVVETRPFDPWYDPVLAAAYAVVAGFGVCLLLGWLLRGLAVLRDRPSAYLPGLGRRARAARRGRG